MLTHKKQKTISKRHVFLMEKCSEDARQDEKHVPDLLESKMRPTDPIKEELRQKLFKIDKFEYQENEGFKILDSGIPKCSRRRPTQPSRPVGCKQETTLQTRLNSKNDLNNSKNAGVSLQGPYSSQKLKAPFFFLSIIPRQCL